MYGSCFRHYNYQVAGWYPFCWTRSNSVLMGMADIEWLISFTIIWFQYIFCRFLSIQILPRLKKSMLVFFLKRMLSRPFRKSGFIRWVSPSNDDVMTSKRFLYCWPFVPWIYCSSVYNMSSQIRIYQVSFSNSWWCHDIEMLSILLALCTENPMLISV